MCLVASLAFDGRLFGSASSRGMPAFSSCRSSLARPRPPLLSSPLPRQPRRCVKLRSPRLSLLRGASPRLTAGSSRETPSRFGCTLSFHQSRPILRASQNRSGSFASPSLALSQINAMQGVVTNLRQQLHILQVNWYSDHTDDFLADCAVVVSSLLPPVAKTMSVNAELCFSKNKKAELCNSNTY